MKKILQFSLILIAPMVSFAQNRISCEVTYIYETNDTNQNIRFTSNTLDSNRIVSWYWDFGDGTSSNQPNPNHEYLKLGTYVSCLTIITEDSCQNTFCDTIIIENTTQDTTSFYSISGNVYADYALLPSGIALLINKNNSHYTATKYTFIYNGHYEFSHLTSGDYVIYAIPDFHLDVNYYPSYLPTYLGNSTGWQDATILTINNNSLYNQNIDLSCNTDILYGNDTISGNLHISDPNSFEYNIYWNNWFGNSNMSQINVEVAPNMSVLLLNTEDEPLRFAITDSSGNFMFKNLPIRIYKISPEKAGLLTIPATVNMQTTSATNVNIPFFIDINSIYSGISELFYSGFAQNINVYPNPAHNSVIININTEKSVQVTLELENVTGTKVFLSEKFISQGNNNYLIPLNGLSSGIYLIMIKDKGMPLIVHKIIKQ